MLYLSEVLKLTLEASNLSKKYKLGGLYAAYSVISESYKPGGFAVRLQATFIREFKLINFITSFGYLVQYLCFCSYVLCLSMFLRF